ncbi:MAG TPA: hypothetical protein VJW20_06215 [Candidatus Angelobacter sp.]|nr:hypothetical protein [Candidatus Angelobacter sp.]
MSDEQYRKYKEDPSASTSEPKPHATPIVRLRSPLLQRRVRPTPDYTGFKAQINSAVEELKLEIRGQHEQTRAEVQDAKREVIKAVDASPAQHMKSLCEFGSLFMLFALAVRYALHIELVNTAFAIFMLLAFGVYWTMAFVKQKSEKRRKNT